MERATAPVPFVSTEEQAGHGVSLEAQEAALRAYCNMRGLEMVELVRDPGVSAGKALSAREGGRRVLEMVKSGEVGSVVAWKLDRLFRDCADCLTVTGLTMPGPKVTAVTPYRVGAPRAHQCPLGHTSSPPDASPE